MANLKAEGDSLSEEKFASGATNLMMAVSAGDIEKVKAYVDAGCAVNFQSERFKLSALHCAAKIGNVELVKLLLDAGADKELMNNHSETAGALAHLAKIGRAPGASEEGGAECEILLCGPEGY